MFSLPLSGESQPDGLHCPVAAFPVQYQATDLDKRKSAADRKVNAFCERLDKQSRQAGSCFRMLSLGWSRERSYLAEAAPPLRGDARAHHNTRDKVALEASGNAVAGVPGASPVERMEFKLIVAETQEEK